MVASVLRKALQGVTSSQDRDHKAKNIQSVALYRASQPTPTPEDRSFRIQDRTQTPYKRERERKGDGRERDRESISEFSQSPLFPNECSAYGTFTYGTFSPLLEGRNLPKVKCRARSLRTPGWHWLVTLQGGRHLKMSLHIRHPAGDLQIDTFPIKIDEKMTIWHHLI